ncbi:hypothetical protein [Lentimicrobium sp. S6]|uniref:hypothetical protein n=1 Tax=Lentimicrobium sp. S6 TaxID=2735872 RepID=UPI001553C42B|nr:hypothetical protein [Lentimicrobium sp. S6]NPD45781.1 hypothetical protein [Lentimicrobium sp. S6]
MKITKQYLILVFLSLTMGWSLHAQEVDVFKSKDMVFYGLDFTQARFTGGSGLTSPASMQDKYMPALNELMMDERKRYDVAKSYKKKNVEYNFYRADDLNAAFDVYDHYVNGKIENLSEEQIQSVVQNYKDEKHSGLGLVYIIDEVSHGNNLISIQIVFFDIDTQEVLLVKRARGGMKGFSIRNYYAGGIRQIIKESQEFYEKWEKQAEN